MADLFKIHLLQAQQWKAAETSLLQWDRNLSDSAREFCPAGSSCEILIKYLTETPSLQVLFAMVLAAITWHTSQHLGKKTQIKLLLFLTLFFILGDFLSNQLKYIFQRVRPDLTEYVVGNSWTGNFNPSFSLPSNHAFNLFAIAAVFYLLRSRKYFLGVNFPIALYAFALFVGISRVFVWRHYPLDIVAGMLFGSLYAYAFTGLICKFVHTPTHTDKL